MKSLLLLLTLIASSCSFETDANTFLTPDQLTFLTAIQQVETGGHRNPSGALGSFGEVGPMQIMWSFWSDAMEYDGDIGGIYQDVKDVEYSQRIADAYFSRWAYAQWQDPLNNIEHLGSIYNGGPRGPGKKAVRPYVTRLQSILISL